MNAKSFVINALSAVILLAVSMDATAWGKKRECPVDDTDPFSMQATMPSGLYRGLCIDTSHTRSSRRLTAEERTRFGIDATDKSIEAIANFRHQDRFWIAVIPLERIQKTYFQLVPLIPALSAYHGQLRFHLSSGGPAIRLIPQTAKDGVVEQVLNEDLVYTLLAVRAMGHEGVFNPLKGMHGFYTATYFFGSISQQTVWSFTNGQEVEQYEVNFTQAQTLRAFDKALQKTESAGLRDGYHTLSASCVNAVFRIFEGVLGISPAWRPERVFETTAPIMMANRWNLLRDGVAIPQKDPQGSELGQ